MDRIGREDVLRVADSTYALPALLTSRCSSPAPGTAWDTKGATNLRLLFGHYCPTIAPVNGKEFIERVTTLGRRRGVQVRVDAKRGKGSHVMLYYGDRKTVVKDRRKDIGPGLLAAMIRQLELEPGDLR